MTLSNMRGIEASDLGLPVGQWPATIRIDGTYMTLLRIEHDSEGDVTAAVYYDRVSCQTFYVWND